MAANKNTYDKIIQAAMELIARQGYHNTSIKNITDKLGITPSAIYAHFKNKAEICHKIIQMWEAEYIDRLIRVVNEEPGTALDKLHRLMSFGGGYVTDKNLINSFFVLRDELKTDREFTVFFTNINAKHQNFLVDLFRMGIRQGVLRNDLDPLIMASLYKAMIRGMYQEWVFYQNQLDGELFIRCFRRVFFKGVEAQPKPENHA